LPTARGETLVVGFLFDLGGETGKVAAVEHGAGQRLVGKLRLLDQIAAAQFERIDAQLDGGLVDQTLDDEIGFRPSGAAIGIGRRGIGHHLLMPAIHGLDVIDAGADGHAVA